MCDVFRTYDLGAPELPFADVCDGSRDFVMSQLPSISAFRRRHAPPIIDRMMFCWLPTRQHKHHTMGALLEIIQLHATNLCSTRIKQSSTLP
jgi:hypothetical protein